MSQRVSEENHPEVPVACPQHFPRSRTRASSSGRQGEGDLRAVCSSNFLVELGGLEPPTFCLPDKRSPSELQPHTFFILDEDGAPVQGPRSLGSVTLGV